MNDAYALGGSGQVHRLRVYRRCICTAISHLLQVQCTTGCATREQGGFGLTLNRREQRLDITGHAVTGLIKTIRNRISCLPEP